jgi:hypothetical protein
MEEKDFPTITPPEAMEEKDPPPAVTELIYFPGCTSQEVPGVQPVIATLLRAIGSCCHLSHDMEKKLPLENGLSKQDSAHQTSPPKIDVRKERIIAGSDVRKYGSCDFTIWVRRRFLVLMLDSSIELTIEVKPGQRIDKKPNALRHEARDQCLSHMSKSLLSCLRLANGAGVPSHATSVFCTLTHIEIFQLQLIAPGTSESRLELLSSGPLPIVKKESFEKWFDCDERHAIDVGVLKEELYPDGMDTEGVPLGIKALYKLMTSPRQDLIGPTWGKVSNQLKCLLGTGTFGMVFQSERCNEVAVKVSKSGLAYYIKREAEFLNYLSKQKGTCRPDSVPLFISHGMLALTIGGRKVGMSAFAMKPVCRNVYFFLSQESQDDDIIQIILHGITDALKFIHRNGISHNDVNDRNILLRELEDGQSKMYDTIEGFRGTPQFTHREIHKKSKWLPVPNFDWTSLGLTMVALIEKG